MPRISCAVAVEYPHHITQRGNYQQHVFEVYVENNPVRAKIVERPHEYRWSSAKSHVYEDSNPVLTNDCYLVKEIKDWLSYLMEKEDKVLIDNIRSSTRTGRPCGDEVFIKKIENLLGRRLNALPKGRPRTGK